MDFLSENGLILFERLKKHCNDRLKILEIDDLELAMLANSFDLYAEAAKTCNDVDGDGCVQTFPNGTSQVRPEYTVMKNEYQNILKHSAKFGLNPGDRAKFFKGLEEKKKHGFSLGEMKKAV